MTNLFRCANMTRLWERQTEHHQQSVLVNRREKETALGKMC